MDWATILGAFASFCSISSFLPQAWKVAKTGETAALSAKTYVLTVTGFAFWTAYGIVLGAWPIMLTNGTCLVLSAYILLKILRGTPAARTAPT